MARFYEPTAKQVKGWEKWVKKRPPAVRPLAERFNPWTLYRLDGDGHRVTVRGFSEDGTLIVNVLGKFNALLFERQVFGVDPDKLVECDLPGEDESLGVVIEEPTEDDIAMLRAVMGVTLKQ
jgi:hypothetical protein